MSELAKDAKQAQATGAFAPLGVYVHFPWCIKKCPYCDFLSLVSAPEQIPHRAYADRVLSELRARASELLSSDRGSKPRRVTSLFVGGGTPSLWEPDQIGRLLEGVLNTFEVAPDIEVTVECNPSSFDGERARALRRVGVSRVSIGVQALSAERLQFLGRWHGPEQALLALDAALEAGFPRVSADLMHGVHGQTPAQAAQEATRLAQTGITHLSAYGLTIEPGTVFGARARQGLLPLLPDEHVADSFLEVHQALESLGFEHYEISNYAKHGHVARHNLGYWCGEDYLGLGTGAWGTLELGPERLRYKNTPVAERYLDAALEFSSLKSDRETGLVQTLEVIEPQTALNERLLLGLRLKGGLDLGRAGRELGVDPWTRERRQAVQRLVERGRLVRTDDLLSIPADQWLLADGTIAELL